MNPTATLHIINFIKSIGINVSYDTIKSETFVPGITIKNGGIIVDAERLKYPGDLLHEAAYIAVTPKSKRNDVNDNSQVVADESEEKAAIMAWVYAAAKHLGMDDSVKKLSVQDVEPGIPLLQLYGMILGKGAYPEMTNWLSQHEPVSERDKMIKGEPYRANDPELVKLRSATRKKLGIYNQVGVHEAEEQSVLLIQLLGECGEKSWIEPPFYCDYGFNITFGKEVYLNFDCVILDVAPVVFGDNVMCGPKVQILAATHPIDAQERNFSGTELGKPVTIGNRVWLGAGVIVCPGVTIGDEAVIGAGSVVTRDIPAGVFAAGNPCRVIREL